MAEGIMALGKEVISSTEQLWNIREELSACHRKLYGYHKDQCPCHSKTMDYTQTKLRMPTSEKIIPMKEEILAINT